MLDVCVADPELRLALNKPNCSRCIKCIRTMVTLEALGKLSSFERVFDLDLFYRERTRLVRQLVDAAILGNFSSREAVDFARRNRVALPASTPLLRSTAALKASIRRLLGSSLT